MLIVIPKVMRWFDGARSMIRQLLITLGMERNAEECDEVENSVGR